MKLNIKNYAFTLAETLIVMGIIGVIAALTIPSLNNSTNNKETVSRVKKAHSVLEDAYGRMTSHYGNFEEWTTLNTSLFASRITSSMKISKNCNANATDTCFAQNAQAATMTATNQAIASANVNRVILADGFSLAFYIAQTSSKDCNASVTSNNTTIPELNNVCGTVTVDIDGPNKGKSAWGKDLFGFYITQQGIYPMGLEIDTIHKSIDNCTKTQGGQGCTAWVVYNNNLDYLKTTSDGKCTSNTSKTLSWTTGNTTCDN